MNAFKAAGALPGKCKTPIILSYLFRSFFRRLPEWLTNILLPGLLQA